MRLSISKALALGIVSLQVVTVCVILASSYLSTEQVLIGHAQQLMRNLSREVIDRSEEFLSPARSAVSLTGSLARHQVVSSEKPDEMEQYFFDQLVLYPHIAGIYYGNLEGDFHFVRRNTGETAFQIKRISESKGNREVLNRWYSLEHALVKTAEDPQDSYDPRTRPWFVKALKEKKQIWTDPYLFFTSKTPGITVASPVFSKAGDIVGVVGVDIDLSALSDFLGFLELSEHASALILNNNGDVIAHRSESGLYAEDPATGMRRLLNIEELKSPSAQAAVGSLNKAPGWYVLNTAVNTSFRYDEKLYQAVFTPFSDNWPWLLGIYVPEDDFLMAIKENRKINIVLALGITLISVIVGIMFARSLSQPILSLQKSVNAVKNGELEVNIDSRSSMFSDIEETTTAFSHMVSFLKENQQKSIDLQKNLSHQAHFMEAVLAAIENGVVVCDNDGKLIYSNRVVMKLRGLPEDHRFERFEDVPFKLFYENSTIELKKSQWPIFRALAEERVNEERIVIESSEGVRTHICVSGRAIFDTNGEKLGAYVSMREENVK